MKAFVVLTNSASAGPAELRDFVAERLAAYKVPRYFEVVADLPHTPTGRIAKHELSKERSDVEVDFDSSTRGAGRS